MERNGASPERTLLIGDSDVDLRTARAAGVRLCLARYGFGFVRVDPATIEDDDLVIDQPSDLLSVLNG
jgi:phosphoglycolate phosphatase